MPRLKLGIIGAGGIGQIHIKNAILLPNVEVISVSDLYTSHVENWLMDMGVSQITNDYQELLNNPDVEAVLICSPTATHTDIISKAGKAGKHVFCEKPLSFSIEDSQKAIQTMEKYDRQLQIGFSRRFDPNFQRIRQAVEGDEIGASHILRITSRDPRPPEEKYIKGSGGIFIDMTIHDFDMARFLTGGEVKEVYARGDVKVDDVFAKYDDIDTAVVTLTFEDGTIGVIDNSRQAVYGYDQRIEMFGSEGSIAVDNEYPNTSVLSNREGVKKEKPLHFFLERYQKAFYEEIRVFADAVIENKKVLVDGSDGIKAEKLAHAAKLSLKENRPVQVSEIETIHT